MLAKLWCKSWQDVTVPREAPFYASLLESAGMVGFFFSEQKIRSTKEKSQFQVHLLPRNWTLQMKFKKTTWKYKGFEHPQPSASLYWSKFSQTLHESPRCKKAALALCVRGGCRGTCCKLTHHIWVTHSISSSYPMHISLGAQLSQQPQGHIRSLNEMIHSKESSAQTFLQSRKFSFLSGALAYKK